MAAVKGISVRFRGKHLFQIRISNIFLLVFLLAYLTFTALPLIYLVATAFKPLDELYLFPPRFFPENPTFENFSDLFSLLNNTTLPFSRYIFNSVVYCVAMVGITVVVSVMCAYGMVKIRPKGSAAMFTILVMALSISGPAAQIPRFLIVKQLGLLDTYWSLILPQFASAFNVFLVRQFLIGMPDAYLEAARLDGANEWQILWKIAFPYARPAWATVVVFQFMATWNDYTGPFLYLSDPSMQTLPLAIATIGGVGAASLSTAGAVAASTFLMTMPSVIIFTAMQSKVLSTMSHSGIKA